MTTRDSWTGTRGVIPSNEVGDWDEVKNAIKERLRYHPPTSYTPEVVKRAWDFFIQKLGNDADLEEFSVREVVEFYLDN